MDQIIGFTVNDENLRSSGCELEINQTLTVLYGNNGRMMLELSADQSRITFYDFDELFGQYESFNNFNMDAFAVPQDAQLPEFTDDYYYGYSDD